MLISIIIPTYNRLDSLKRCIVSISRQICLNVEVIVVDDASVDATAGWLASISKRYTWLKIITNTVNAGVNYARNRGIEQATGKYILFLDSDDQLDEHALMNIITLLNRHTHTKHFLFLVSDRKDEFDTIGDVKEIEYEDWMRPSIKGDFTHVICTAIMKRFLFFEQFRMYEHLNWLRVLKTTDPQLLVPIVAARRERNRSDSLTSSAKLKDLLTVETKFEALQIYYALYYDDLKRFGSNALQKKLLSAVLLGGACNRKKESHHLIALANRPAIRMVGLLMLLLPPFVLRKCIFFWSALK